LATLHRHRDNRQQKKQPLPLLRSIAPLSRNPNPEFSCRISCTYYIFIDNSILCAVRGRRSQELKVVRSYQHTNPSRWQYGDEELTCPHSCRWASAHVIEEGSDWVYCMRGKTMSYSLFFIGLRWVGLRHTCNGCLVCSILPSVQIGHCLISTLSFPAPSFPSSLQALQAPWAFGCTPWHHANNGLCFVDT
jgi:hypothetical protein